MNLKNTFSFLISLLLAAGIALAQQASPTQSDDGPPVPDTPGDAPRAFSMFISGGSYLGVYAEDITRENMARYGLREARGVGITQVIKDSPAEKAGLRKDDVIVRFEGDSVTSSRKLNRLVSEVAPDQTVKLGISRGGGEQEVAVTIGKRSEGFGAMDQLKGFELKGLDQLRGLDHLRDWEKNMPPGANVWKWEGGPGKDGMIFALGNRRRIGVGTMPLTKQLAEYFGISDGKGVLITSVSDDSPAAKAGLRAGDVITAIDGEKVEGAGDVARGINKKKDGDVTLTVIRNKNQRTVTVTPKDAPMPTPGAVIGQGDVRTIVIPRVELGEIPEVNIQIPRIAVPATPEIKVVVPRTIKAPKVRVITTAGEQPI
ncbi:MAG TPA: PDZ domain-containing protein [Pyrinomonadaceae bacterium]|jgi:membrane-associated protease RseP (regulator of RpoE activity)|nr:PDZ domain-containing protein [Pyrinomonadaceae bacterium]